jgi:hypothetical protein
MYSSLFSIDEIVLLSSFGRDRSSTRHSDCPIHTPQGVLRRMIGNLPSRPNNTLSHAEVSP